VVEKLDNFFSGRVHMFLLSSTRNATAWQSRD
jgi:hypothetical protein